MATESKTYNGWTNYETWCVNLWMDNVRGSHNHWLAEAAAVWQYAEPSDDVLSKSEKARYALADLLKGYYDEEMPDLGASLWADMLNAAFSEVNWDEIANNLLDDCDGYESR